MNFFATGRVVVAAVLIVGGCGDTQGGGNEGASGGGGSDAGECAAVDDECSASLPCCDESLTCSPGGVCYEKPCDNENSGFACFGNEDCCTGWSCQYDEEGNEDICKPPN
jgi:hypothetical protein